MTAQLDRMARAIRIAHATSKQDQERLARYWDANAVADDVRAACYRQAQAALDAVNEPGLEPREDGLHAVGVGHIRCPCGEALPVQIYAGLTGPDDQGYQHVQFDSDTTELWAHMFRHQTQETD